MSFLFFFHHLDFPLACDGVGFVRMVCWRCMGDLRRDGKEWKMQKKYRIRAKLTTPSQ
jgi:hypothetical protein